MEKLLANTAFILFFTAFALPVAASWSFVTVSDSYSGFENGLYICYLTALTYGSDVKFLVATGDLENPALIDSYFQTRLLGFFPGQDYASWFATLGNHSCSDSNDLDFIQNTLGGRIATESAYLPGMRNLKEGPPSGSEDCGRSMTTYSFDYENAHFVMLNQYDDIMDSGGGKGCMLQQVYDWLKADLEQNNQPIVFVFGHEPAFPATGGNQHCGDSLDDSSCPGNASTGERFSKPMRDKFWGLLAEHRVVANFAGHIHAFSARQIHDKNDFYSLPCTLTAGGGGCSGSCVETTFCCYSASMPEIANGATINPDGGVIEYTNDITNAGGGWNVIRVNDDATITFLAYDRLSGAEITPGILVRSFEYDASSLIGASSAIYVDNGLGSNCSQYNPANKGACGSGTGTAYRDLAEAANNAVAGNTVMIRGGTYNELLRPMNSGTAEAPITFTNYGDEEVLLTGMPGIRNLPAGEDPDNEWNQYCIYMWGKSHIVVDGLKCDNVQRWARIMFSDHITLQDNRFSRAGVSGDSGSVTFISSHDNRIINNVLDQGNDNLYLVDSNRNLIQGNRITSGRHTLWAIKCGNNNVVRGNYFHNQIQKIGEIYDCNDPDHGGDTIYFSIFKDNSSKHNLVENNAFAYTAPDDGDGPFNSIQYAGQQGIIRNNVFYDSHGIGLGFATYSLEARYNLDNRAYNNVFYNNIGGAVVTGNSSNPANFYNNIFKNNIFYKNTPIGLGWADNSPSGSQVSHKNMANFRFEQNNILGEAEGESNVIYDSYNHRISLATAQSQYSQLYSNNIEVAPGFVNETGHDFNLNPTSQMIDKGAFLAKTDGSGTGATMTIDDVGYFFDGFGVEGEFGDEIQLAEQTQTARITGIDYANKKLTLDSSLSWVDGQGVGLAYKGNAPDMGAFESNYSGTCITMQMLNTALSQWKQGSMTMPALMENIRKWTLGEGC